MNFLYERREFESEHERDQYKRVLDAVLRYPHAKKMAQEHTMS